ncbi:hypothetical protein [Pleionea sp. CnH1-48]|uniref:RipA family octameric membrane protein n=1 Tax=Pleionea sp. CnH1-48 TaxID=2954494 RepID=UPI002097AA28|nr:hypothetical protein [Pleionea sp. CnH1-48]MCO7227513.1 hypothetical protein [Pleionea sp. CnH1-48]
MQSKQLHKKYKKRFKDPEKALEYALDARKFEIELYWKRATYFWAFIAITFVAFLTVQANDKLGINKKGDLSVFLSCIGVLFSCAWLLVNKASKYWQENWENQVFVLEDISLGPLYKSTLKRPKEKGFIDTLYCPVEKSVSKINMAISLCVVIMWLGFLVYSLNPICFSCEINWPRLVAIITMLVLLLFLVFSTNTHLEDYHHELRVQKSIITDLTVSQKKHNGSR